MRLFLIGMPGSGKTTVARNLAKAINYEYVDLDGWIERDAKMFIEEIFERYGEDKFRELETEMLTKIPKENTVVACGGGIITRKENKELMTGIKFYLDTDLDIIKLRLETDYQRPLLKNKSLELLFDERYLKYQDFADVVVSNNQNVDETVNVILNYMKNEEYK